MKDRRKNSMNTVDCCGCRPLAFLLALPCVILSLFVSIAGVIVWAIGSVVGLICPCCLCVPALVDFALELIKAPLHVLEWLTSHIPC
ncbi:PREDICTED: uncharacterized protein LOC104613080 [Nelumbo nucifera]|uniref:Uncharacterized protein LOC104613080 n=1 Tax=Nelumbo nucifera TaxID=4432 RepID=A0A1U8BG16_NELNU|nr:PREDICTED: uncharacterized protein LOC104613080 [Nelumbo nucifera]